MLTIENRFADVNGIRMHFLTAGSGDPVILMHGWPLSADTFDDMAIAIANSGRRAIAYDRRGFGRSAQPWDGYNYDRLADDLEEQRQVFVTRGRKQLRHHKLCEFRRTVQEVAGEKSEAIHAVNR